MSYDTYTVCTGAAMAMYLGGVPVFAIMMIGQWSCNLLIKYIQKKIEEFTVDASKQLLTVQNFQHTHYQAQNGERQNLVAAPI